MANNATTNATMVGLINGILSGNGHKVVMYNASGNTTLDFNDVNRLFVTGKSKNEPDQPPINMMVELGQTKGSSPKPSVTFHISSSTPVKVVETMKKHLQTSTAAPWSFNIMPYGKTLEPKHFAYMNKTDVAESAWTGSTRTSRLKIGLTEVVIRHSARLDDCENPRRWTRIADIFIHGTDGSRYKFPFKHILGAKAMAQHMDHSGAPWDETGAVIQNVMDVIMQLRALKRWCNTQSNSNLTQSVEAIQNDLKSLLKKISQSHTYMPAVNQAHELGTSWQTQLPTQDMTWPENLEKAITAVQPYLPAQDQPEHMDSMELDGDLHALHAEPDSHMDDEMPTQVYREERELMEWFKQFDVNQIFEVEQDDLDAAVEVSKDETGSEDPVDVYRDIENTVTGLGNKFENDPAEAMKLLTNTIEKLKKLR
jgi:hypothetical protein